MTRFAKTGHVVTITAIQLSRHSDKQLIRLASPCRRIFLTLSGHERPVRLLNGINKGVTVPDICFGLWYGLGLMWLLFWLTEHLACPTVSNVGSNLPPPPSAPCTWHS